jgi:hypothetical protein
MYQFNKELYLKVYFRFDKVNVKNKRWSRLPTASKSIYPVIAVHCDSKGIAFPSEQTIAILSGRTPKTVRHGIAGLMHYPGITIERYVTGRGHRGIKYHLDIPPEERGRSFSFYKCIVAGGNWSQLTPGAHSLYPVMQAFSFFDSEEYSYIEDTEYGHDIQSMIEDGEYQNRVYDFCNADIDVLADFAGIGKKTAITSLTQLEDHFLIEQASSIDDRDTWKIFRTPPKIYKADWLNGEASRRYGKPSEKITY